MNTTASELEEVGAEPRYTAVALWISITILGGLALLSLSVVAAAVKNSRAFRLPISPSVTLLDVESLSEKQHALLDLLDSKRLEADQNGLRFLDAWDFHQGPHRDHGRPVRRCDG